MRVADSLVNGSRQNLSYIENQVDLVTSDLNELNNCLKVCKETEIVLNLAAKVAGVAYNSVSSADMFHNNLRIGLNMLEAARRCDVERFLVVSSACVYSRESTIPTPEEEGFLGDPEPSNLGYGWAKRVLELQGRLYADQYGIRVSIVRPFNTYGPRDHFDTEAGHVIPSLIEKVMSQNDTVVVWGNGEQTRSFVYVADLAASMLSIVEKVPQADPINVGSEEEISIGDLAKMIIRLSGGKQRIIFDKSKPQGQPRRQPDLGKSKSHGVYCLTPLSVGLRNTIDWYSRARSSRRDFAVEEPITET